LRAFSGDAPRDGDRAEIGHYALDAVLEEATLLGVVLLAEQALEPLGIAEGVLGGPTIHPEIRATVRVGGDARVAKVGED
jgi:hypothetical protein